MENQPSRLTATPRSVLLEQAKGASTSPGVYLMKDSEGTILYVGKAKNLKNRLTTYFQGAVHDIPRIEMLVARVHHFDVILTETEAEALILECTLIKKHKPKFNIRLKDDKAYPYLKIQMEADYPRVEWTRRVMKDGARYFGPFPSAWAARQVMELLNETLLLRDCSDNTFRHRSRACILHEIGKCSAPCVGKVSREQYRESVQEAIEVLEGKGDGLLEALKKGMADAAEREEYEVAALYRDQIKNLEVVTATQVVDEAGVDRNRDVMGVARRSGQVGGCGVVLQIRGGRMLAVKHFHLQNADPSLPEGKVLADFIAQHYIGSEQGGEDMQGVRANELLLPSAPEDVELLERTFGLRIYVPETAAEEQLVNVARTNAEHSLEQAEKRSKGHGVEALEEVQKKLHLPKLPHRIECYDISNIQGEDPVASRVVFIDGAPDKSLYRRYRIRTVVGSNDFAMMKEVLERRFTGTDARDALPDLLIVDGGKGQLSQATTILEELGIPGIGVVGLAKARVESDFQSAEVKSSHERIFIPGRKNPVPLLPHTEAYKLLTHVRDEAHRFAITFHRQRRDKRIPR